MIVSLKQRVQEIKKANGCLFCGEDDPYELQFHHVDPSQKLENVSSLVSRHRVAMAMQEIAKCVVVCSWCHSDIHLGKLSVDPHKRCVVPPVEPERDWKQEEEKLLERLKQFGSYNR